MGKIDYLKIIADVTNKASETYFKYKEYKSDPNVFRQKDLQYSVIFEIVDNFINSYSQTKTNDSNKRFNDDISYNLDIDKCYEILESNPKDTNETIKSNYRRLAREYHPDTIASKDLPKGFHDFANSKIQEINLAYDIIKKERNL